MNCAFCTSKNYHIRDEGDFVKIFSRKLMFEIFNVCKNSCPYGTYVLRQCDTAVHVNLINDNNNEPVINYIFLKNRNKIDTSLQRRVYKLEKLEKLPNADSLGK